MQVELLKQLVRVHALSYKLSQAKGNRKYFLRDLCSEGAYSLEEFWHIPNHQLVELILKVGAHVFGHGIFVPVHTSVPDIHPNIGIILNRV